MAATFTLVAAGQNYACDGLVDELDGGKLKVKAADDTLLITFTLGSPAFGNAGAAVDGRATANAIADATAVESGTATKATLHKSDDTEVGEMNVSTSGASLNIDSTSIVSGNSYGIASFYIQMPTVCA